MPTLDQAISIGKVFAKKLGCSEQDLQCMRSKDISEVQSAADNTWVIPDPFTFTLRLALTWQPCVDGIQVPNQTLHAVQQGKFQKVPIIIGTNTNEGVMFAYQIAGYMDNVEYAAGVAAVFKEYAVRVLKEYPVTVDPLTNVIANFSTLLTDYVFACST